MPIGAVVQAVETILAPKKSVAEYETMKLAVFKDYRVGRYFAQLFDSIPDTTFFLSEKNESTLNITPHRVHLLTKKQQLRDYLKSPLKAWRRLQENDNDKSATSSTRRSNARPPAASSMSR